MDADENVLLEIWRERRAENRTEMTREMMWKRNKLHGTPDGKLVHSPHLQSNPTHPINCVLGCTYTRTHTLYSFV